LAQALIQVLPGVIVEGLLLGCVYAMIALGYSLVYGVLGLINFAHSEVFMVGAVAGAEVYRYLLPVVPDPFLVLGVAVAAGGGVAGLVAVGIERLAYRPLRQRTSNRLVPLITAIGVSFLLQDLVRLVEGLWHNEFYLSYPSCPPIERSLRLPLGAEIQVKAILVIAVAVLMMVGLALLVKRTRLGKAIRAVAHDTATASLLGVDPDQVISRTFLLGGCLGGVAGVLFGVMFTQVNPFVGFTPGLKAFTAAVLGGIGSIPGAMVGGLVLGLIETLGGTYLPLFTAGALGTEYTDILAFAVLVALLLLRPQGLLGKAPMDRA
jgi:branched-chain amino acid transport system permease protein